VKDLDLGQQPTWLTSHNGCTYNPEPSQSPTGDCGNLPTLHILLRNDDGMIAACSEHQAFALRHLPAEEWHAWGAWCNMPGALWHHSPTPDEADSWCALDETGDASSRAKATEVNA
jgi:hypothetical protein